MCGKLEHLDVKNTEIINEDAFYCCQNLESVTVHRLLSIPHPYGYVPFEYIIDSPVPVDFPSTDLFLGKDFWYKTADVEFLYTFSQCEYRYFYPKEENSFYGHCICGRVPAAFREKIRSVKIPPDVVKISGDTFADCINLEAVILHDGMEICENAFRNCPKLKYLVIPGYDPVSSRFIVDEYDDGGWRRYRHMDPELGCCDEIGEAELWQNQDLRKLAGLSPDYIRKVIIYSDPNVVFRSHWIRVNIHAVDHFMDLHFCDQLPPFSDENP